MSVKSFAYQLQNVDINNIAKSKYDLVVIDNEHTKQEISKLKPKKVIAYISIGEAEDYRSYWKKEWKTKKPEWLGKENQEWKGNYTVKEFWNPAWWEITKSQLDEIIDKGYDGIAMDKVDVYIDLGDTLELKLLMIDFVSKISEYCKAKKPGFLIIAHNCSELVKTSPYVDKIDGITQEDLVYDWNSDGKTGKRTSKDYYDSVVKNLKFAISKGKQVFVIEYVSGSSYTKASQLIKEFGGISYSAPRDLGAIRYV